jgi:hypothetical protein
MDDDAVALNAEEGRVSLAAILAFSGDYGSHAGHQSAT